MRSFANATWGLCPAARSNAVSSWMGVSAGADWDIAVPTAGLAPFACESLGGSAAVTTMTVSVDVVALASVTFPIVSETLVESVDVVSGMASGNELDCSEEASLAIGSDATNELGSDLSQGLACFPVVAQPR